MVAGIGAEVVVVVDDDVSNVGNIVDVSDVDVVGGNVAFAATTFTVDTTVPATFPAES